MQPQCGHRVFAGLVAGRICFSPAPPLSILPTVTVDTFKPEILQALRSYDKYVVCVGKTPEEFEAAVTSLMGKAIKAFQSRGPELRHGIALDKQITVILSQTDNPRPLCGIYFNLHSPYQKPQSRASRRVRESIGGSEE